MIHLFCYHSTARRICHLLLWGYTFAELWAIISKKGLFHPTRASFFYIGAVKNTMKMKQLAAALLCLLLLPVAGSLPVRAASIVDDFSSLTGDENRSYSSLADNWAYFGGVVASGASYSGSVLYRATGVETIRVQVTSLCGTFAVPDVGAGCLFGYDGAYSGRTLLELWMSDARDRLFADFGGRMFEVCYSEFAYQMQEMAAPVPRAAARYGISVYCAPEGAKQESSVVLRLDNPPVLLAGQQIYSEEYTAQIPKGTRRIRVELNDYISLPKQDGTGVVRNIHGTVALSRVELQGASAMAGSPQPAAKPARPAPGGNTVQTAPQGGAPAVQEPPPSSAAAQRPVKAASSTPAADSSAASSKVREETDSSPQEQAAVMDANETAPPVHELGTAQKGSGAPMIKVVTAAYMAAIGVGILAACLKMLKPKKRG